MTNFVTVTFYQGLRPKDHIIDRLVQPEVPVTWEPAFVDIQQRNVRELMELANISPSEWRASLIERFSFDVLNPTPEGLRNIGVPADRVEIAMDMAREQQENWEIEDDIDDLWSHDKDMSANLTPVQVYEVLAETGARGTPVICFRADEQEVMSALAEDNLVTVCGAKGIFVGLSDPINGYNWSPEGLTGKITFRPSCDGIVVLGDDHLYENVVDDAYTATVAYEAAPEVRFSSATEETMRLGPPTVRDERPSVATKPMAAL